MEGYHVMRQVGSGAYGRVFKGRRRGTGQVVALKFMTKTGCSARRLRLMRREPAILRDLRHPNIVRLLDSYETERHVVIVTDFAEGQLHQILEEEGSLAEHQVRKISCQLVSALHYLHCRHVLHRDLKPDNILLDQHGSVKLCDFGFAWSTSACKSVHMSLKGTPIYMSPERLQEQPYDHTADLWALGCVLYEVHTGAPPFFCNVFKDLVKLIVREPVTWPTSMSDTCQRFLRGLLTKNPRERLSWPDLLHHPFVADRLKVVTYDDVRDKTILQEENKTFTEPSEDKSTPKFIEGSEPSSDHGPTPGAEQDLSRTVPLKSTESRRTSRSSVAPESSAPCEERPEPLSRISIDYEREFGPWQESGTPQDGIVTARSDQIQVQTVEDERPCCEQVDDPVTGVTPAAASQESSSVTRAESPIERSGPRNWTSIEPSTRRDHQGQTSEEQEQDMDQEVNQLSKLQTGLRDFQTLLKTGAEPDHVLQTLKTLNNLILTDPIRWIHLSREEGLADLLCGLLQDCVEDLDLIKQLQIIGEMMVVLLIIWDQDPVRREQWQRMEALMESCIPALLQHDLYVLTTAEGVSGIDPVQFKTLFRRRLVLEADHKDSSSSHGVYSLLVVSLLVFSKHPRTCLSLLSDHTSVDALGRLILPADRVAQNQERSFACIWDLSCKLLMIPFALDVPPVCIFRILDQYHKAGIFLGLLQAMEVLPPQQLWLPLSLLTRFLLFDPERSLAHITEDSSFFSAASAVSESRTGASLLSDLLPETDLWETAAELLTLFSLLARGSTARFQLPLRNSDLDLALTHSHQEVRTAACRLLGQLDPFRTFPHLPPSFFRRLIDCLDDACITVRRSACSAVGNWLRCVIVRAKHKSGPTSRKAGSLSGSKISEDSLMT